MLQTFFVRYIIFQVSTNNNYVVHVHSNYNYELYYTSVLIFFVNYCDYFDSLDKFTITFKQVRFSFAWHIYNTFF